MPATKITDLLPIPAGTRQPHAYQIFGLEDGEQDLAKISAAVNATIARLKSVKSTTDPKLWGKAAKLVQHARAMLADPEKKAHLDARFGIISIARDDDQPAQGDSQGPEATDPLAGVLPSADPLAGVLPSSNPLAPAHTHNTLAPVPLPPTHLPPVPQVTPEAGPTADMIPQSIFGIPTHPSAYAGRAPATASAAPVQVVVRAPRTRRRKKSLLGIFMFATFAMAMFGLVGLLAYFLLFGPGQVAITSNDGKISISTQPTQDDSQPQVGLPGPVARQPRPRSVDPVMGTLGGDVPIPSASPEPVVPNENMQSPDASMTSTPPTMMDAPAEPSSNPQPESATSSEPMPAQPEPMPLTEEMIAAAETKLERVRTLIRQADWKEMKGAAESALEARMTDAQKSEAEALYDLADLATYYRGAIERAVADLNVGNDFAVTDDFRVIVVEKGEDLLVVRYDQKSRSFKFDEFPFSLAHKLATFSVPASPMSQAAKAAYQAIAPNATDAYRDEAIAWLRDLGGQVEGTDTERVAETIESLYAEDDA
jgi:hypothetical protein